MADNVFYISAGLAPIDNSTGATANTFYISAGLVPDDTEAAPTTYFIPKIMNHKFIPSFTGGQ